MSDRPRFGFTRHGLAVHGRTIDHLKPPPGAGWYARFNAWLAVKISKGVGSMTCAYLFAGIALWGLPQALKPGGEGIVSWIAQTFLQLVLLSVIMVGQSVMGVASDARSAKTFEDVEVVADRLDTTTKGGITDILSAIHAQGAVLDRLAAAETSRTEAAARALAAPAEVLAPAKGTTAAKVAAAKAAGPKLRDPGKGRM